MAKYSTYPLLSDHGQTRPNNKTISDDWLCSRCDGTRAKKEGKKRKSDGGKQGNAQAKKRKGDTVAKKKIKYQQLLSDMDDNEILNRCKLPELLSVIRANKVYTDSEYGEELCSLLDSLKGLYEWPVMVEYVRDLGVKVLDAIAAGDSKKLGPMADERFTKNN